MERFLHALLGKWGEQKILHGVVEMILSHKLNDKDFVLCHSHGFTNLGSVVIGGGICRKCATSIVSVFHGQQHSPVRSPFSPTAAFADNLLPALSPFFTDGGIFGKCATSDVPIIHRRRHLRIMGYS
jgi:hypothetical protein